MFVREPFRWENNMSEDKEDNSPLKIEVSQNRAGPQPTLSTCMIVKDEEKFLHKCLESVRNAVDEIVIVDTGSTDRTVEIAEGFGARVYHHPWRNSFSEARNHSLKYASGDWILQIDADETLDQDDIPLMRQAISGAPQDCDALFVALYNDLPEGRSKHYFQRIYRRGRAHYEGIVHNQLVYSGRAMNTEIRLYHAGYNLSKEEMKRKYERTGALLRRQIEQDPENTFAHSNLVRVYRNQELFDQAIEEGERALELKFSRATLAHRQMIASDMAYCLIQKGKFDRAEKVCLTVLEENPDNLDILFILGGIYFKNGEYEKALGLFKRFLRVKKEEQIRPKFNPLIVDTYSFEDKVWNSIGDCYKGMGYLDQALDAYGKAIDINPRNPLFYGSLALAYLGQDRSDKAEEAYLKAVEQGIVDEVLYFRLGEHYRQQGKTEKAIAAYRKSLEINESYVDAHNNLGHLLFIQGKVQEAEGAFKKTLDLKPDHIGALCGLAKLKSQMGQPEAMIYVDEVLKEDFRDPEIYLELGNICADLGRYDQAIELFGKYLQGHPEDARVLTNIATCYAKQGNTVSAQIGYQAALQINPNYSPAVRNLQILERLASNPS